MTLTQQQVFEFLQKHLSSHEVSMEGNKIKGKRLIKTRSFASFQLTFLKNGEYSISTGTRGSRAQRFDDIFDLFHWMGCFSYFNNHKSARELLGVPKDSKVSLRSILSSRKEEVNMNNVIAEALGREQDGKPLFYDHDLRIFLSEQGIETLRIGHYSTTFQDKDYLVTFEGEYELNSQTNAHEFSVDFNKVLKVIKMNNPSIEFGTFNNAEFLVILERIKEFIKSGIEADGDVLVMHKSESGTPFESHKSESNYHITNQEGIDQLFDKVYHPDLEFVVSNTNGKLSIKATGVNMSFHSEDYVEIDYLPGKVA